MPELPISANNTVATWVAAYTKHHFEKIVYRQLINNHVEVFLPLRKVLRKWSDRKKWIEVPLFQNYIFAKVLPKDQIKILKTRGVFSLVSFNGKVATIPESEIEMVRRFIGTGNDFEVVDDNLSSGELVVITKGSLMGMQGRMLVYKGNKRIALNIEYLGKTILMDVPIEYVSRCAMPYESEPM